MIVIIDDDLEYVMELKSLLIKSGHHRVEAATTASDGFVAVEKFKPDIVILDLMLPESPTDPVGARFPKNQEEAAGVSIALKLKEIGFDLRRIVGITTLSAEQHVVPVRRLGVEQILFKPVLFSEILNAIEKARVSASLALG